MLSGDGAAVQHEALRVGALRDHLREAGLGWTEDPMNEDPRFERVRARQALAALAPLGIDAERLAAVACCSS